MSVNISFKQSSNQSKWDSIKNGDFIFLDTSEHHPIDAGLYRVFEFPGQEQKTYAIIPLFEGVFTEGMFPYMIDGTIPPPPIAHKVNKLHIDVEFE